MSGKHPLYDIPLPAKWELLTVDDLKAPVPHSCVAGPFGSSISSKVFQPEGIPVIRGSNLRDDLTSFVPEGFVYVSEDQAKKYKAQHVTAGDLVFTCWGTIGQVGLIPENGPFREYIISNKQLKLRPDIKKAIPRFLFYYFAGPEMVKHIQNHAIGAAVPGINLGILKSLEVALPPLSTQQKIAAILSAYDDMIENNLRRIKILEEMAQNIYREWFVKFRFPSHQHTRFIASPLGRIPGGWEMKAMTQAVIVRPSLPVPKNTQVPFVPMGSLSNDSMLISDIEYRSKASGARFQNGDTLFARITPCLENGKTGFVQFLPTDESIACGSTEFIVLRSKTVCPEYVYLMARSEKFRDNAIKSMSGATGRQRVREECFDQFFLAQPPEEILNAFQDISGPQFKIIDSLNRRNQALRHTRDLLLPKLISGEVDVSDLDITIPEEAAV